MSFPLTLDQLAPFLRAGYPWSVSHALDLRTVLDALTTSLDEAGIPYAVCGALALAIHGHPRATKDIDLLTAPDQIVALKAVARVHGFTLEALPMTFSSSAITIHRVSRLVGAQDLADLARLETSA